MTLRSPLAVLITFLATLVGGLIALLLLKRRPELQDSVRPQNDSEAIRQTPTTQDTRDIVSSGTQDTNQSSQIVQVQLVDAFLQQPIPGSASIEGVTRARCGSDGVLELVQSVHVGKLQPIYLSSPFHESTLLDNWAGSKGKQVVLLNPSVPTTIRVLSETGQPYQGADISLQSLDDHRVKPSYGPEGRRSIATTTASGSAEFMLGVQAVAAVRVAPDQPLQLLQISPGDQIDVCVPQSVAIVRFVEGDSGVPVSGLEVTAGDVASQRGKPSKMVTDENGAIRIGGRRVLVQVTDPRVQSVQFPDNAATPQSQYRNTFLLEPSDPGQDIEFRVVLCEIEVKLWMSGPHEQLDGPLSIVPEKRMDFGDAAVWRTVPPLRRFCTVRDQGFIVACAESPASDVARLRIEKPGFEPVSLSSADLAPATAHVVTMQPCSHQNVVRLLYPDGTPFVGEVVILDEAREAILFEGPTEANGAVDLVCAKGPLAAYARPGQSLLGRGSSGDCREGTIVITVQTMRCLGSLVVQGVPPGAPLLIARSPDGTCYPGKSSGSEVCFAGLCSGDYLVGSETFVGAAIKQGLSRRATDSLPYVRVNGADASTTAWRQEWMLQSAISGSVICDPAVASQVSIRPIYGQSRAAVPPNATGNLFLDAAGRYVIPAGLPQPSVLLLCGPRCGQWTPVWKAFAPGKDVVLDCGTLILTWAGPKPKKPVLVGLKHAIDQEVPFELLGSDGMGPIDWWPANDLTVTAPTNTKEVWVEPVDGQRRVYPVHVVPGANVVVRVSD